jgi:hypothetical protein
VAAGLWECESRNTILEGQWLLKEALCQVKVSPLEVEPIGLADGVIMRREEEGKSGAEFQIGSCAIW